MSDEAKRCAYTIEKKFKGQRYVYSRRRCKNKVKQGDYCYLHGGAS